MGNIIHKFDAGKPSVSLRWRQGAVVKAEVIKNEKGRFVCRIKVDDGEFFNLPSSHPTEKDAIQTLNAYIAENSSQ